MLGKVLSTNFGLADRRAPRLLARDLPSYLPAARLASRYQICQSPFCIFRCAQETAEPRSYEEAQLQGDPLRPGIDPGAWLFSPEWMGTQAGGWGHNAGEVVFEAESSYGNGRVSVTRHYASKVDTFPLPASAACTVGHVKARQQEWRVLRFQEETRQSVARAEVTLTDTGEMQVIQRPDCMAFLYMKTLAAAVASMVGLAPSGSSLSAATGPAHSVAHNSSSPRSMDGRSLCAEASVCRVLCIGLGGGTLPLFLLHHFPGMVIDVVELDPAVIEAAQRAMGFPRQRQRLRVHQADAVVWLRDQLHMSMPPFDIVFVDAFNGDNDVPMPFTDAGGSFLPDLAEALHPEHGVVMVNLHRGELPSLWKQVVLRLSGLQWLDPLVTPVAKVYRQAIVPGQTGQAYMLGVGKQYNTIVVAARGQHLTGLTQLPQNLQTAAAAVAEQAKYRFDVRERAALDFNQVP